MLKITTDSSEMYSALKLDGDYLKKVVYNTKTYDFYVVSCDDVITVDKGGDNFYTVDTEEEAINAIS